MEKEEVGVVLWLISFLIVLGVGFKLNQNYPKYADLIFVAFMPITCLVRALFEGISMIVETIIEDNKKQ